MTFGHSWIFVDGNSWMAIREYHDLWSFVGLFVDGNSWMATIRQLFGNYSALFGNYSAKRNYLV